MKTAIHTISVDLITFVPEVVKMAEKFIFGVVLTTRALRFTFFFFFPSLCCQVLTFLNC